MIVTVAENILNNYLFYVFLKQLRTNGATHSFFHKQKHSWNHKFDRQVRVNHTQIKLDLEQIK